jgi:hypothetical protein
MKRRLRVSPFAIFAITMLLGMIVATLVFRHAQTLALAHPAPRSTQPYTGHVTDAQQLYIEARTATSELLFKLAFAALTALIGIEASEGARARFPQRGLFAAAGLLFTSIYAAFLFQNGVGLCMEASLDDMFGPILAYPIVLQFWSLFAAAAIVATALFQKPGRIAAIITTLMAIAPRPALAAPLYRDCVTSWAAARSITLPREAAQDAEQLIGRVVARQELKVAAKDRCAVATTLLDDVRYMALRERKPAVGTAAGAALAPMLHEARVAAESPNLSPGELVERLLSIAEVWSVASGILDIDADKPLFVIVTDRLSRPQKQFYEYTRCVLRLRPGKYNVRVAQGTRIIFDNDIELAADARVPLVVKAR